MRYKVMYGGRGSAKSWSVARALLILGSRKKLRVLCTREIQKTLADSVHKLLKDQIEGMQLDWFYDVQNNIIRGRNGTEFLFTGLSDLTAHSIKSYEGVDICWVEEAQTVTKKSWDLLCPTIRKEDMVTLECSEIWVTFNPELDTDATYVRFVTNPPANAWVCFINYTDNPWFPNVLELERLHCLATAPDDYDNIWLGACKAAVAGAIYAKEVAKAQAEQRVTFLPYDPNLKVHAIWDLGFADNMAITMVQRSRSEVRCIDYLQVNKTTTDECAILLRQKPYNWGFMFLPHDGFSEERKTGTTDAKILAKYRFRVKRVPKTNEEDRIKVGRAAFPRWVFDKEKTKDLLECLKRYRRPERANGADATPIHDEYSHGCLPAGERVLLDRGLVPIETVQAGDKVILPTGDQGLVINAGVSGLSKKLVTITLADGKKLRVTPNHRMLTLNGIVFAGDLVYGDSILIDGGVLWPAMLSFSMDAGIGLRESISIVMINGSRHQEHSTETCGSKQTDQSPRGMMSTILTKISATTISLILNCFPSRNTCGTTVSKGRGKSVIVTPERSCLQHGNSPTKQGAGQRTEQETPSDGKQTLPSRNGLGPLEPWPHLRKPNLLQGSGTAQKKAEHGIAQTGRQHGKSVNLWLRIAQSVARNMSLTTLPNQSSAARIVKLETSDVEGQPVYNLTVEKHNCYLAEGMLVSNSDSFGYACQVIEEMTNDDPITTMPRIDDFQPISRTMGY